MSLIAAPYKDLQAQEDAILEEYLRRKAIEAKGKNFLDFVKHVAPWFIVEEAHILIAHAFEELASGENDRLMIFMPPRTGKSTLTSVFLPLWWVGNFQQDQVLHTSYAATLVEGFGRQIKNALMDDAYREVFPGVELTKDSKASAKWAITAGGMYHAAGVGAGIAGKGWNLGIVDDPMSEQDMYSATSMESIYNWFGPGFYTRRQPERNVLIVTMTRWNMGDLAGRLLANAAIDPHADQYKVIKLSAILDQEGADLLNSVSGSKEANKYIETPYHYSAGDSFAPRRWPKEELLRTKAQNTSKSWASLYQQSPYEEEGGILPRTQWKKWPLQDPPRCEYVIQSYDTAFEEKEASDYSVRTTWGIFRDPKTGLHACILLERFHERVDFPTLREEAYESYLDYEPDRVLIEKKASGHSLLQELRKRGVPIKAMAADKSKWARAHAASIVLEQGLVYYMPRNWADEVIDECAAFPNGAHDDYVDSCVHAWNFLRRMFHLQTQQEIRDEELEDMVREPVDNYRHKRYTRYAHG